MLNRHISPTMNILRLAHPNFSTRCIEWVLEVVFGLLLKHFGFCWWGLRYCFILRKRRHFWGCSRWLSLFCSSVRPLFMTSTDRSHTVSLFYSDRKSTRLNSSHVKISY